MQPICAKCRCMMTCKQNDFGVNDVTSMGFASTYWLGDLYACPICDAEIVTGFGRGVIGERTGESVTFAYEPKQLASFASQFTDGGE